MTSWHCLIKVTSYRAWGRKSASVLTCATLLIKITCTVCRNASRHVNLKGFVVSLWSVAVRKVGHMCNDVMSRRKSAKICGKSWRHFCCNFAPHCWCTSGMQQIRTRDLSAKLTFAWDVWQQQLRSSCLTCLLQFCGTLLTSQALLMNSVGYLNSGFAVLSDFSQSKQRDYCTLLQCCNWSKRKADDVMT